MTLCRTACATQVLPWPVVVVQATLYRVGDERDDDDDDLVWEGGGGDEGAG